MVEELALKLHMTKLSLPKRKDKGQTCVGALKSQDREHHRLANGLQTVSDINFNSESFGLNYIKKPPI
jgi:hypothetical protein